MPEKDGKLMWLAMQILAVILFLGILAASYFFLFQPELQKYETGGPLNIEAKEELLGKREKYKKELEQLYAVYQENVEGDSDKIGEVVPGPAHLAPIYAMLDTIALGQGVALQVVDIALTPEQVKNPSPLKEILISMKATNVSYSSLKGLLDAFEKNKRLTDVALLDYDSKSKFLNLNVKMYYLGERKK